MKNDKIIIANKKFTSNLSDGEEYFGISKGNTSRFELGASLTGFTLYIFTVYAAIYGYLLFDEKLENYHYVGTAFVFFGVYLAKKKNVKQS